MATWWPWLAVAGLGALHGLSPANGWMFAAERGIRSGDSAQALRALLPIAVGHAASVAMVVCAVAQGVLIDRVLVQVLAGALLVAVALHRWLGVWPHRHHVANRGHAGIAVWSCMMATVHGAGLMLVPALLPLCMTNSPAREITASGSLAMALAAVGLHLAVMLATTGAVAAGVCRGIALIPDRLPRAALRHAWTVSLAITGAALLIVR
ncbi:hypothetical protein MNR01_12390 [Lysobacter sp. S4-A87]|uniref:hypothetical protein n=1 Tax=Lysobacter sp. S4-A87 TaxID=2925843 RepID=UPI001F52CA40|nr:hypothetical protein [Lysobacter sp. S4-A87]UNK48544.1 hypothetical protein MNR01_12390 [Lysobacter sp. S4-A87]